MRLLGGLLLLIVLAAGALPFALLAPTPAVEGGANLDTVGLTRARALMREHDPRQLHDGEVRTIRVSAEEVDLVLTYLLRSLGGGSARVFLAPQTLRAAFTAQLPANPLGSFFNVELALAQTDTLPTLTHLRIGRLELPRPLAQWLVRQALKAAYTQAGLTSPGSLVRAVSFSAGSVALRYEWQSSVVTVLRNQLSPLAEQARVREFHQQLVASASRYARLVSLPDLAAPLFAFALLRAPQGDPVADNRAALLVLANYVTGKRLAMLIPDAANWPVPQRLSVRIYRREDLVQHFVNSALIAATGGEALAQTFGLEKEIDDSRGGSGFSFVDLLADKAGTRFGQGASASRDSAIAVQRFASAAPSQGAWIPNPEGLRENLTEQVFKQRYGGVDGAGYRAVLGDIETRLANLPVLK